jgi:hypothetical protein
MNIKEKRQILLDFWQQYNEQLAKCNSPKSTESDFQKLAKIKQKWHEQSNNVGYLNTTQINYKEQ